MGANRAVGIEHRICLPGFLTKEFVYPRARMLKSFMSKESFDDSKAGFLWRNHKRFLIFFRVEFRLVPVFFLMIMLDRSSLRQLIESIM